MAKRKPAPPSSRPPGSPRRAVLVTRVSTHVQETRGRGKDGQLAEMRRYIAREGLVEVDHIHEQVSGQVEVRERESGKRLYAYIDGDKVGQADAIVFDEVSRTARDDDVVEFVLLRRDIRRAGLELHFADSGADDGSWTSGVLGYLKAAHATAERQEFARRATRRRRLKARAGWVGVGVPPYGHAREGVREGVRLVIDPETARIVRLIYDLYLGKIEPPEWFTEQGYAWPPSLNSVAAYLQHIGVPTPGSGHGWPSPGWQAQVVRMILQRRSAVGEFHYADEHVSLPELAIVSEADWQEAQARLLQRRKLAKRNREHPFLLAGMLRCTCGRTLYGRREVRRGKPYTYYHCGQPDRHLRDCSPRHWRATAVEAAVWDWVCRVFAEPGVLEEAAERAAMIEQERRVDAAGEGDAQAARVDEARRQYERLVQLYASAKGPAAQSLLDQIAAAEAAYNGAVDERDRLAKRAQPVGDLAAAVSQLADAGRALGPDLPRLSLAGRREFLTRAWFRGQLVANPDGSFTLRCELRDPLERVLACGEIPMP